MTRYFSIAVFGAFLLMASFSVGCRTSKDSGKGTAASGTSGSSAADVAGAQTNSASGGVGGSTVAKSGNAGSISSSSGGAGRATSGKAGGSAGSNSGNSGGNKAGSGGSEAGSGGSKGGAGSEKGGSGGSSGTGGTTKTGVYAIIVKAAGYVTQGDPDTLSYDTYASYNVHMEADILAKLLEGLNVAAEVINWLDCANMECVHVPDAKSTASIVVFAGPTYLAQIPQEIRDLIPALQKISPPPKVTSIFTSCRFTQWGQQATDAVMSSLNAAGFKTVPPVVFAVLDENLTETTPENDKMINDRLKAFAESLVSAL